MSIILYSNIQKGVILTYIFKYSDKFAVNLSNWSHFEQGDKMFKKWHRKTLNVFETLNDAIKFANSFNTLVTKKDTKNVLLLPF